MNFNRIGSTLFGLALAALLVVAGAPGASASAVGTEDGFLTLSNPETGVELAAWCANGRIDSIAVVNGDKSYQTGAPVGTKCTTEAFADAGFVGRVNIDPWNGWVVVSSAELDENTDMAFTCTHEGPVYAIKYPNLKLRVNPQTGECGPGYMPG